VGPWRPGRHAGDTTTKNVDLLGIECLEFEVHVFDLSCLNNQPFERTNVGGGSGSNSCDPCVGVPLKSSMLSVKHEVAQLSISIWKESESYLIGLLTLSLEALKHNSSEVLETSVATG
jgi:hypothetical protein